MTAMTVLGSLTLPGVKRSVAHARRFPRDMLGPDHPAMDDIELCTSELVTNSVLHSDSGRGGHITIVAAEGDRIVQISVTDDGTDGLPPPCAPPDPEAEDGRGLVIVKELADEWGVDVIDGRTTVWFRISS
jgi:anti-sigma regulatory factor (Ser/Thr protein kinase)